MVRTSRKRLAAIASISALAGLTCAVAAWGTLAGPPAALAATVAPGPFARDLSAVRDDGVLRVAVVADDVAFVERRGRREGLVADLSEWLAAELGVDVAFVHPRNPAHGMRVVLEGGADLLAVIDPGPRGPGLDLRWSVPLERARPVVIGRDARAISRIEDLRGRSLAVRRHSTLEARALEWRRQLGGELRVVRVPPQQTDRLLAARAASRESDLVLLDELRARLEVEAFGPLEMSRALGEPLPVRWGISPAAPELARVVDRILEAGRRDGLIAEIGRRYLDDPLRLKALRRPVFRPSGPRLSPWDGVFQSAADAHGFDWRLIAALSFAESGYDRWEVSPVGAMGLLQLMPSVARAYGAEDPFDPRQNVEAGAGLLRWLYDLFDELEDADRAAFAIAAYNVGIGHLEDARQLAASRGLDANRWEGHVEMVLPLLADPAIAEGLPHGRARGAVTVQYVRHVFALWRGFAGPAVAALTGDDAAAPARG